MPFKFTKDIFCVEGIIHALEEAKKDKENKDTGRLPCSRTVLFPGLGFVSQQERVVGSAPADRGAYQGAEHRRVRFRRHVEISNQDHTILDHASFLSNTKVGPAGDSGQGLFATKTLAPGVWDPEHCGVRSTLPTILRS